MSGLNISERMAAVAMVALALGVGYTGIPAAMGAVSKGSGETVAEAPLTTGSVLFTNNVMMRFEEDGDLFDGHVRVILSPESRPLSLMQARAAAQKAFMETINEPALSDVVNQITIIVEMVPEAKEGDLRQTFLYRSDDGKTWSLTADN